MAANSRRERAAWSFVGPIREARPHWYLAVVIALGACGVAACGSTQVERTVTVTASQAGEPSVAPAPLPKRRRPGRIAAPLHACDQNISVKRFTTSCPFAQNVFYSYWLNETEPGVFADSPGLPAYSPARGKMFYLDCSGGRTIACRSGNGAYIQFPASAVARYTAANAEQYATSAELGDVPAFTRESTPVSDPPAEAAPADQISPDDCDPNYEGECLDPNTGDYDCLGGSGNGPNYTGPVTVVGDDHFGLDRNGDGIGCE